MNVIPTKNRMLVKRDDPRIVSTGGVFIPEVAQVKPQRGKVVSLAPGHHFDVNVGDVVWYGTRKGIPSVKHQGEPHDVIVEADVFFVEASDV